jgi:RNA polymerase sigma-70 factor (ECF subfamily)
LADVPENIIEGCKKGKQRYQEELYHLLSPRMYGLCLKYANNRDDAKDIMQDGFIKVFQKIDQYGGKGSFEGWVRRIMINTALEKYRSQVTIYSLDERMPLSDEGVQTSVIENLSAEDLLGLIRLLTPKYRMVFNLYAIEGYNHKEIGELLGISEGTSKSNLSRARVILQEKVKELYSVKRDVK